MTRVASILVRRPPEPEPAPKVDQPPKPGEAPRKPKQEQPPKPPKPREPGEDQGELYTVTEALTPALQTLTVGTRNPKKPQVTWFAPVTTLFDEPPVTPPLAGVVPEVRPTRFYVAMGVSRGGVKAALSPFVGVSLQLRAAGGARCAGAHRRREGHLAGVGPAARGAGPAVRRAQAVHRTRRLRSRHGHDGDRRGDAGSGGRRPGHDVGGRDGARQGPGGCRGRRARRRSLCGRGSQARGRRRAATGHRCGREARSHSHRGPRTESPASDSARRHAARHVPAGDRRLQRVSVRHACASAGSACGWGTAPGARSRPGTWRRSHSTPRRSPRRRSRTRRLRSAPNAATKCAR